MAGGECAECSTKRRVGVQTKLKINEPGDIYEQEADRIADRVMATPTVPALRGASPRIQRYTGQAASQTEAAPASVDRTLAGAGRPLEPALQQDMEQRFSYDFSRVRIHCGTLAEQSARDVNAHAYAAGNNVVFGAGQFALGTHTGRRLIAHELSHVVQQVGSPLASAAPSTPYLQREKAPPQSPPPSGTCQSATLADQFKPTNTWGGKTWDPKLGEEFGTTSKLAANFGFGACKEGGFWKFHLSKLEVMITSKVQPTGFRTNVASANDAEVTQDKVPTILGDLRPNRKVTFRPGCGSDKYDDKVTTYSVRSRKSVV